MTSPAGGDMKDTEKVFAKNENVVFRQIADEAILVPVRQHVADLNCIYTLNEVGAFVWSHIDGQRRLSHIIESLVDSFAVNTATAQEEVCSFISQLESKKLIKEIRA